MRLRLVLIASLLAAMIGPGASIAVILAVFASLRPISTPGLVVLSTFILPAATTLLATIFVYRHTARRRKLQAIATAILTIALSLTVFLVASIVGSRNKPIELPEPTPQPSVSDLLPELSPISCCTGRNASITKRMCSSRSTPNSCTP
jgi:branched-subunit amino acid ABC-type transport system permease component